MTLRTASLSLSTLLLLFGCGEVRVDVDGDGSPSTIDCDDNDASLNDLDLDGDGYSTCDGDCDDGDAGLEPGDLDNDGVSSCDGDCDDADSSLSSVADDGDCDGIVTAVDCNDADPLSTTVTEDQDCDGVLTANDCDDTDPSSTVVADDQDCDGVLTANDCDDADPSSTVVADDQDCDGAVSALDCDDNDSNLNLLDSDGDTWTTCDGDCDDSDSALNLDDVDNDGWDTCGALGLIDECYTVVAHDSYGDGWDNSKLVFKADGTVVDIITVLDSDDQNYVTSEVCVEGAVAVTISYTDNTPWDSEVGFVIRDSSGSDLYVVSSGDWTNEGNYSGDLLDIRGSYNADCDDNNPNVTLVCACSVSVVLDSTTYGPYEIDTLWPGGSAYFFAGVGYATSISSSGGRVDNFEVSDGTGNLLVSDSMSSSADWTSSSGCIGSMSWNSGGYYSSSSDWAALAYMGGAIDMSQYSYTQMDVYFGSNTGVFGQSFRTMEGLRDEGSCGLGGNGDPLLGIGLSNRSPSGLSIGYQDSSSGQYDSYIFDSTVPVPSTNSGWHTFGVEFVGCQ